MNPLADPNWGVWIDWLIERASWIITIVLGLLGLPYAIQRVKALRKEVSERPKLRAGFGVGIEPATTFRLDRHEPVPSRSKVVPFDIHVINIGKKSARDILLNVLFDSVIASEHAKRSPRSIDGRYFSPEEDSRTSIIIRQIPHIHPDDHRTLELWWHFPFRPAEYDVLLEASAAEMEPMRERLKVRVTTDPEVRHVPLGR